MNITFLVGNGFDLRLGLKTRYTDMYTGYIATYPSTKVIRDFKQILQQTAPEGYKTWGDFEMAMAHHAKTFGSEQELIECVRDFKEYMGKHLLKEQTAFMEYFNQQNGHAACAREMKRSLLGFYKGQTPNVINAIETLGNPEHAQFNFITFNYTTLLDQIIQHHDSYFKIVGREKPIHIHGSLDTDVVLGIDNINQFGQLPYSLTKRGERAFVKPLFNSQFDQMRTSAAKKVIETSDIICVYGMSFGQSDATWIREIYEWIIANPNHHLIYYKHLSQQFSAWKRDEMMDEEDSQREELLKRICGSEELEGIENQVHIPIGYAVLSE